MFIRHYCRQLSHWFSLLPFSRHYASRHCRHCFRHAINAPLRYAAWSAADFHHCHITLTPLRPILPFASMTPATDCHIDAIMPVSLMPPSLNIYSHYFFAITDITLAIIDDHCHADVIIFIAAAIC
jgi:hypothetical protein